MKSFYNSSAVCALKREAEQELRTVCTHYKQSASGIKFMHTSCAQETLLHLCILRARRSLNSVQIQQDQRLLVIRNAFLVLILLFPVIDIDCPDKLRRGCFCSGSSVCPSPSKRPDRLIDVDRVLQIQQFAVVKYQIQNSPPKLLSKSSFHKRVKTKNLH